MQRHEKEEKQATIGKQKNKKPNTEEPFLLLVHAAAGRQAKAKGRKATGKKQQEKKEREGCSYSQRHPKLRTQISPKGTAEEQRQKMV